MNPTRLRPFFVFLIFFAFIATPFAKAAETGFERPFSGPARYLKWAPIEVSTPNQINKPLGQLRADRIAAALGFRKSKALTTKQYLLLISGQGVGGGTPSAKAAAKTIDESVNYLTNSNANIIIRNINGVSTPINLGSYGLIVNEDGVLESPANTTSPCRQVNTIIQPAVFCPDSDASNPTGLPCGYLNTWLLANGAEETLVELYRSAFLAEAVFGGQSQKISGVAQLVPNKKGNGAESTVGMSMAPSIWITNFLLIYTLNPKLAALMPAYWSAIPEEVVNAIASSESGQVPYSAYQSYFAR